MQFVKVGYGLQFFRSKVVRQVIEPLGRNRILLIDAEYRTLADENPKAELLNDNFLILRISRIGASCPAVAMLSSQLTYLCHAPGILRLRFSPFEFLVSGQPGCELVSRFKAIVLS